jgi:HD superfamily phosphohydrolase
LAGKLAKKLKSQQPELHITVKDVLCVQIAGLCHDLGHGPFSHLFDQTFIPMVREDKKDWKHEEASVEMFRHMCKTHNLKNDFKKFNLGEDDLTFIEELINGPKATAEGNGNQDWEYEGRKQEKGFLYEIVANKRTGVDVDKWDYFARDCHHLGMKNAFDHNRLIKFARVIELPDKPGRFVICTRDKEVVNLYDMFNTRTLLHRRAYQHKTVKIIEYMIAEALREADKHMTIPVDSKKRTKMSMTVDMSDNDKDKDDNLAAYTMLDDSIYLTILHSTDENLLKAREILQKVERRQLYRFVAEAKPPQQGDWKNTFKQEMPKRVDETKLSADDVVILEAHFNYGMKDKDPVEQFYFYRKTARDTAFHFHKDEVSKMLPEQFSENLVRIYWKKDISEVTKELSECLTGACEAAKLQVLWTVGEQNPPHQIQTDGCGSP